MKAAIQRLVVRRRTRWIVLGVVSLACGLSVLRFTERTHVLAAIELAGGRYKAPRYSIFEKLVRFARGQPIPYDGYDLSFNGPKFDDVWLEQHHDLRSLTIEKLILRSTRFSPAAIRRMLARNDVTTLTAPGMQLTDADARLIGDEPRLESLNLSHSEITDVGLAALKISRLRGMLSVAGTRVTGGGLRRELAGAQLQYLWLDGTQFTPELAAQIAPLKSLQMFAMVGPDVTDAHVKLLESLPYVTYFRIEQTSVSSEALAALRTARPTPAFAVEAPSPGDVFFPWPTE